MKTMTMDELLAYDVTTYRMKLYIHHKRRRGHGRTVKADAKVIVQQVILLRAGLVDDERHSVKQAAGRLGIALSVVRECAKQLNININAEVKRMRKLEQLCRFIREHDERSSRSEYAILNYINHLHVAPRIFTSPRVSYVVNDAFVLDICQAGIRNFDRHCEIIQQNKSRHAVAITFRQPNPLAIARSIEWLLNDDKPFRFIRENGVVV